jgi:hypothetical protein
MRDMSLRILRKFFLSQVKIYHFKMQPNQKDGKDRSREFVQDLSSLGKKFEVGTDSWDYHGIDVFSKKNSQYLSIY